MSVTDISTCPVTENRRTTTEKNLTAKSRAIEVRLFYHTTTGSRLARISISASSFPVRSASSDTSFRTCICLNIFPLFIITFFTILVLFCVCYVLFYRLFHEVYRHFHFFAICL